MGLFRLFSLVALFLGCLRFRRLFPFLIFLLLTGRRCGYGLLGGSRIWLVRSDRRFHRDRLTMRFLLFLGRLRFQFVFPFLIFPLLTGRRCGYGLLGGSRFWLVRSDRRFHRDRLALVGAQTARWYTDQSLLFTQIVQSPSQWDVGNKYKNRLSCKLRGRWRSSYTNADTHKSMCIYIHTKYNIV